MGYKYEFAEGSEISHCSVGAIQNVANNNHYLETRMQTELMKYLRNNGLLGAAKSIPKWNDNKARTLDEVREAFLMAAKDLRNKSGE
jgi:hypothetical protein